MDAIWKNAHNLFGYHQHAIVAIKVNLFDKHCKFEIPHEAECSAHGRVVQLCHCFLIIVCEQDQNMLLINLNLSVFHTETMLVPGYVGCVNHIKQSYIDPPSLFVRVVCCFVQKYEDQWLIFVQNVYQIGVFVEYYIRGLENEFVIFILS